MEEARAQQERLPLPDEPVEARAEWRAFIEDDPEEGLRRVNEGRPLSDLLWEEWGEELATAGMDRERFVGITRGYADEVRLWVMGERVWAHCVAGLRGRLLRRLPRKDKGQETVAFATERNLAGSAPGGSV